MKYVITFLLIFLFFKSFATHIVGGEFELIHQDSFRYELRLIMYFDDFYGNPEAEDSLITAHIFSKERNLLIRNVDLVNIGSSYVPYTNLKCALGELVTRKIIYTAEIILSPEVFIEPEGYYVVWERCCRNNVINNIINPSETGMAFYLEFPPVQKSERPFENSSPILFPPLRDYACVNNFYYADFQGFDPDGDSLVYSIVQPLAGFSSPAPGNVAPPPRPGPYPRINWISGISTANSIPGNPPLEISDDGLLTLVPSEAGLFVFSVLCEEFRNGSKIGETRRDFQMLVIDCPDPGDNPVLTVRDPSTNRFTQSPPPYVFSSNENKCIQFVARDYDGKQNLQFRVEPVNFSAELNSQLSVRSGYVPEESDSVMFEFCFPDCPFLYDQPHIVDIIAGDDTCPLPLSDTIRLVAYIEPPPNQPARFDTTVNTIRYSIREGEVINLDIDAFDPDGDSLTFNVRTLNFDTADFDMVFNAEYEGKDKLIIDFFWDSSCRKYDFNEIQDFTIYLLIDDNDYCKRYNPDTLRIDIAVELPPNTAPIVTTDLGKDSVALEILQEIDFSIFGNDLDQDVIRLYAEPIGFDLEETGFSTLDTTGNGTIVAPFEWKLDCQTIDPFAENEFRIRLIIEDDDKCKIRNADTLDLTFTALLPSNNKPYIEISDPYSNDLEVIAGESILIDISGIDLDEDSISLFLLDEQGFLEETNALFTPVNGKSQVKTTFEWLTDCRFLGDNFSDRLFEYQLVIKDYKCLVPEADTIDLNINLKNREVNDADLFIPNVFTPNQDGYNEFFMVLDLPEDNCNNQFLSVAIYNRYGKEVFFSKSRDFKWSGDNVKNGVYYYLIKFSETEYKGFLHVLH